MNVIGVDIQGPAVIFHHRTNLVVLRHRGLLRSEYVSSDHVEYGAGRNDTALGELGINRPVILHAVAGRDIRQPIVVVDAVRHKSSSTDTRGSAGKGAAGRIGGRCSTKATDQARAALEISVVLVLVQGHLVVGVFDT